MRSIASLKRQVLLAFAVTIVISMAVNSRGGQGGKINGTGRDRERLRSVLVRGNEIFASTLGGLYKADRGSKRWERLRTPEALPPGGLFAQCASRQRRVYYYTPSWIAASIPSSESLSFGLYCSRDSGLKWKLVSSMYDFRQVYVLGTDLYGIADMKKQIPSDRSEGMWVYTSKKGTVPGKWCTIEYQRILRSSDGGATWLDISHGIGLGVQLFSIFRDPDHKRLVCLVGNCIRGYVLQATDVSYEWKWTRIWDWQAKHETDATFFGEGYSTETAAYMYCATLSNYFDFPFGERTQLPAFQIRTAATYAFEKGQPVVLPLQVVFLPGSPTVTIPDATGETGFWGLRRILPSGQREYVPASFVESVYRSKTREDTVAEIRRSPAFGLHELGHDKPYRRSLTLSKLCGFNEPGTYRVQVLYSNTWVADRNKGEWSGTFASPVFEIEIKE